MASTPVRALQPAEKALSTSRMETASDGAVATRGCPGLGCSQAQGMDQPDGNDGQEPDDEHEGGDEEGACPLAQPAEIERGDDQQDPQAHRDHVGSGGREGRGQLTDAGGDRDGDGQGVVDDQRRPGQLAGLMPEVVAGHRVGAAPVRIGVDDLPVGDHQDDQQDDDGDGDGQDEVKGGGAGRGQDDENGLGPVGDRGQRIEGEGGQAFDRGDLLGCGLSDGERRSFAGSA